MTVISRKHRFVYLKSMKTAGTSVEAHLITNGPLGEDIWSTAAEIRKFRLPLKRRYLLMRCGARILASRAFMPFSKLWPQEMRVIEHQTAASVAKMLGGFWDRCIKVTSVRNPWDLMVSAWQWRCDGRGGRSEPASIPFHEWLSAALSGDSQWQRRAKSYDVRGLIHPFAFIDGRCVVDLVIRQEAINEGLRELGELLNLDLGAIAIHEKKSNRERDYRPYYTDELAEAVQDYFSDVIALWDYSFDMKTVQEGPGPCRERPRDSALGR